MTPFLSSSAAKARLSPGSLVHIGEVFNPDVRITLIHYDKEKLEEKTVTSLEEILHYKDKPATTWVNIEGLQDVELIGQIGRHFKVHTLVQEDILNTHQRAKFDDYEHYLFIVIKSLSLKKESSVIDCEQISLLVFNNFLFTFREKSSLLFESIKQRIQNSKGRIRLFGSDYLAYVVLDSVVDDYFVLQDALDEWVEAVEDELLLAPENSILKTIQKMRREVLFVRKAIAPLRELLGEIVRSESHLINQKNYRYFADSYDHVLRIMETMESTRELIIGMLDIYLSSVNNKMSETMKVLTAFASIFIPLTFVAGVYGMNFEYMPELKMRWAYPALWVFFISTTISLIVYFKRKKWL